ncbi:MAG: LptF/LptG family permease [Epsilonproteobacteria bacterium]|nr:LptF/LptG family permease [Campylobacterota bacterium]
MTKVSKYVLSAFFQSFLSLFFTLFFLVTVITFIRISKLTSLFSVSFIDLFEMYLYLLPEIITYILPVTFFIALTTALFKMSKDNESIVLFAMSLSPTKISRLFFYFSSAISLLLLINAIFFIPISKQLGKNFVEHKKIEAKVNLKSSEFGQKFATWNVFVNEVDAKNGYEDIVLFERDKEGSDTFILADSAVIDKNSSLLALDLLEGSVYSLEESRLRQIDYEKLKITYNPDTKEIKSNAIFEYWYLALINKSRARDLSLAISVALFPLVSYLFAISFGIANLRHESPNVYLNMFFVILIFYLIVYQVATMIPLLGTGIVLVLFYLVSHLVFHKKVLARY